MAKNSHYAYGKQNNVLSLKFLTKNTKDLAKNVAQFNIGINVVTS